MADTKVTGKKYRVCTNAQAGNYDLVSFWTDASDVDTNPSGTTVSLDKQLAFVDMGTVPSGGGTLTKTYSASGNLINMNGALEIYVDDAHSKCVPTTVSRNSTTLTLTFPSSAAGAQVKVRCWK